MPNNSHKKHEIFTLVELLMQKSEKHPNQVAYTFLEDGEKREEKITLSAFEYKAKSIAVKLLQHCQSGDRALIIYEPGIDYIAAFFGCLFAGVIAVPIYPPRLNKSIGRVEKTYINSQAKVALTTSQILNRIISAPEELNILKSGVWIATDDLNDIDVKQWSYPKIDKDSLAFLQYTSGSTGDPKGVMVSHGNLLENLKVIKRSYAVTPDDSSVIWLPPYHDMGLIGGILEPLYSEIPVVLISPVHFLQKPFRWLKAMSTYNCTISGGPNFSYDLCCQRISDEQCAELDLSNWKLAFNGAEMVRKQTVDNFYDKFKICGFRKESFYSCYGLAEATLFVTGGPQGVGITVETIDNKALEENRVSRDITADTAKKELVGSGLTIKEQQVVIVNPDTLSSCPPEQIGEICIKGECIAKGYWNKPEESAKTFQMFLKDSKDGPYMRTGDLGFIINNILYVVGRIKDLIIVNGKNYYPTDIESSVARSHPAIKISGTAAFSVDEHDTENLVIVAELERSFMKSDDFSEIIDKIKNTITEEFELSVSAIALIKTSSLDKTSSGKIQRFLCKKKFLDKNLEPIYEWRNDQARGQSNPQKQVTQPAPQNSPQSDAVLSKSGQEIENWLIARVSQYTGFNPEAIDPNLPFSNYGMDSVKVVSISGELEDFLKTPLSPTILYNYPTIHSLSLYLSNGEQTQDAGISIEPPEDKVLTDEPIAIIGMACRFPGAENLDEYWQLLCEGRDAVTKIPKSRWDIDKFYDPDKETPGKTNSVWGGFLNNIDQFDPTFFGISPKEASFMDPQQRLLLETAWVALENSGKTMDEIKGSKTGVFIGCSQNEYGWYQFMDYSLINTYSATGCALGILANRISYIFDLKGPSITLDTICSSSLISVHLACQSLRNKECNLALAGGVNLILTPNTSLGLSKLNLLADDGRCKVFDAKADGIVRSEGVALVVLKRLSKALADNDRIYAVIQNSAVNQDGKTNGITAPNGISQADLLKEAYRKAKVSPSEVHYIETHGTGTILGDPIEANAIGEVVKPNRSKDRPCYIGSVKTNLGHCESIGGLASLIKVALAIKHRTLPPNIHYQSPNPHIDFENGCMKVPDKLMPWPYDEPAIAGVNSFAFGGTNCHMILKELQESATQTNKKISGAEERARDIKLLTISAFDKTSLYGQVKSYLHFLEKKNESDLYDICFSSALFKTHFERRLVCLFDSKDDLVNKLAKFLKDETNVDAEAPIGVFCNRKPRKLDGKMTFVYPESDLICYNHALNLMSHEPVFSGKMDECETAIAKYQNDWSFKNILAGQVSAPGIEQSKRRSLTLFAIEVSLTSLWESWGIHPGIVAGIGIGELAAAHVAGFLSLEDAVYKIIQFSEMSPRVSSTVPLTIPNDSDTGDRRIFFQKVSSTNELLDLMIKNENHISIEIGNTPDFLYQLLGKLYVDGYEIDWKGYFGNGGQFVNLPEYSFHKNAYWVESKGKRITYDDIYERFTSSRPRIGQPDMGDHPLVGHYLKPAFSSKTHIWELEISLDRFPYLTDHRVFGTVVVPSAFLLEMVLAVTEQVYGARYDSNVDLHIKLGIFVPDDKPVLVQLVIDETAIQHVSKYKIYSRDSGNWKGWALNAEGKIHYKTMANPNLKKQYLLDRMHRKYPLKMKPEEYYGELTMRKMGWGPTFQGIKNLWYQNAEALGEIHLPALLNHEHGDYAIHPALLDAAFQVLMATIPKSVRTMIQDPYLLIKLDKFKLYKKCPPDFWSYASLRSLVEKGRFQGNVKLFDDTGELIAEAGGMILQRLGSDGSVIDKLESIDDIFYELEWQKSSMRVNTEKPAEKVSWLIFATDTPVCNGFLDLLEARNDDFITIYPGDFFGVINTGSYKVRPADKRDLIQLMFILNNEGRDSFNNVVHFWNTDPCITCETTLSTIGKAGEFGFMTMTYFIQVIKEKSPDNLPLMWLITEGAISPVEMSPNVTQSDLWGLSKVISLEHPEIWGGIIDLDPAGNTESKAETLLSTILQPKEERQLAFYDNQYYVPRIIKSNINQSEKLTFTCQPDSTYLITGGFGGLGFMIAKWLITKGAKFIVLTGRRRTDEYSSEIMEEIERLKENGIDIQVTRMDVTQKEQVTEVLSLLKQSKHPLRGIIHTAGLLEDKLLMELTPDSFNRAIGPKVIGSWNLHEETKDFDLDFFVLFSSLVSFMGQPGQASYAAANTFMDVLAHYRRKIGLPALSINWGPWSEVGMAAHLGAKGKAQYSAWGLNYISPKEGVSMMEVLLMQKESPQVATIKANWTQLIYNFSSMQKPAIFSTLLGAEIDEVLKQASSAKETLLGLENGNRKEFVTSFIKKEIASILGYAESEIDMDLSLSQLGIDSLAALEFRNSIEKTFGVVLPLDILFQNVSANELTHKVIENLKG